MMRKFKLLSDSAGCQKRCVGIWCALYWLNAKNGHVEWALNEREKVTIQV